MATTSSLSPESPATGTLSMPERVQAIQLLWKEQAKELLRATRAVTPLAKPAVYDDLEKLAVLIGKIEHKLSAGAPPLAEATAFLASVTAWRNERQASLRERLGRELKLACDAAGLSLKVISREDPLQLRIPPLAVSVDLAHGYAELGFAKAPLGRCAADAAAIVAAHARLKQRLETKFDPRAFFDQCHAAWCAARSANPSAASERVEMLEFLPYLALRMQKPKFRSDPTKANFSDYGRAQFAFDVLRLQQQLGMVKDRLRLNFGVATGTTASQKSRVVHLEDADGNGEFKLTVFFTKHGDDA